MSDELKPLRWTTEPPRVPGFFWVRVRGGSPRVGEFGEGGDLRREPDPAISYAGPIPEPVDADEPAVPTLRDETAAVLVQLDELAAIWGDEGVFRRCRDRLRAALERSDA